MTNAIEYTVGSKCKHTYSKPFITGACRIKKCSKCEDVIFLSVELVGLLEKSDTIVSPA